MAARLDDDGSCLGDVDAKHLEEHRVSCLVASGDYHDREAPDPQRSGWSNIDPAALEQAELADEAPIAESNHVRLSFERNIPLFPGRLAPIAVEPSSELRPGAQCVRLGCQCRVEERAVDDVLSSRRMQGHEQLGGSARSSTPGIIAGIGID